MKVPVDVLWCGNARQGRSNGWSFPPRVDRHLRELCADKRVLHQFGGLAKWGTRIDIDPTTRPDVLADAWMLPFGRDAFDVVIVDPPYRHMNQQMKNQLLRQASFVAKEAVVWFHTMWIAADSTLRLERAWLVRVGDTCAVRCLLWFVPKGDKPRPQPYFTRGPAIKYNRWLIQPERLNFE